MSHPSMLFFFFKQKTAYEILGVTGVQTCALPISLVLGQDVDLRLELGVRGGRTRLHDDLTALDVLALDAAQEQADVLTGARLVEQLAEHLDEIGRASCREGVKISVVAVSLNKKKQ